MFKYDENEARKEVTITVSKEELARVYAVMGMVNGIPNVDRFNYRKYQDEWLSILFPVVDEKTQKINELEQIINEAKAKIDELKS